MALEVSVPGRAALQLQHLLVLSLASSSCAHPSTSVLDVNGILTTAGS
jgi:hypothetical protein